MSILIRDSLTGSLIDIGNKKSISMYVCGPTVYLEDGAHLGHGRVYIVYDTIRRILENYFNIPVTFVMNITDIDDKIIKRSIELYGKASLENCKKLTTICEDNFFNVMATLSIKKPTVLTRVTEYIEQIVVYIQQIINNGYATIADDGSVYFNTQKFSEDGFNNNPFNLKQIELTTDDSGNFCLWKGKKETEPFYNVIFNGLEYQGRPAWHIECSAMASYVLDHVDIHGGGIDLMFPHHNNEILQSCAHDHTHNWCDTFVHCGHLSIAGQKMAKSEKNFIQINDFLKKYSPQSIRMYFLMHDYSKKMELSIEEINNLLPLVEKFKIFFNLKYTVFKLNEQPCPNSTIHGKKEKMLVTNLVCCQKSIDLHLRNNFDCSSSINLLNNCVDDVNNYIQLNKQIVPILRQTYDYVIKMLLLFGIEFQEQTTTNIILVDSILQIRNELRTIVANPELSNNIKKTLYQLTDNIRDKILPNCGISLSDIK